MHCHGCFQGGTSRTQHFFTPTEPVHCEDIAMAPVSRATEARENAVQLTAGAEGAEDTVRSAEETEGTGRSTTEARRHGAVTLPGQTTGLADAGRGRRCERS
jgi:hypothetical protein